MECHPLSFKVSLKQGTYIIYLKRKFLDSEDNFMKANLKTYGD